MKFTLGKSLQSEPVDRLSHAITGSDHAHLHHGHGESAGVDELHFKVQGMTCAGCAAAVQRAVESQPGVQSAAVSVTEGRATVTGTALDPDALIKAIQDKGYSAEPIEDLMAPAELKSEIELRQAQHEREWRFRAIVGLSLWVPMEILHWTTHALELHGAWVGWVLLAGATIVFAVAGAGFYRSAWGALKRGTTNMDTLIALGATAAYLFSLVVFVAQLFGRLHDQPLYFAESAALLGIISLGHWLEARATAHAGSAVRELLELQPDKAEIVQTPELTTEGRKPRILPPTPTLLNHDQALSTIIIPSSEVQPGDLLLIRPGARVPIDGEVVDGESDVDEAVVTGESIPVAKRPGDHVVAGSVNTVGRLLVRSAVDGRHTTVARIAEMVQRAQSSKANIQRLADRVAAIFVPTVLIIAAITLLGWTLAGSFTTGLISMVTVLIISCPCALGLATPMAVMVGAGAASKRGILIKSAMALETAGNAQHVIFDKTGTLTAGRATVTGIEVVGNVTWPGNGETAAHLGEHDLLRLAAAVEAPSEHPIAQAIVRAAQEREIAIPAVQRFQAIPGQGVQGIVDGVPIAVLRDEAASCRVEMDGKTIGRIMVSDELRPDARAAIDRLHEMGLTVTMLSGDRRAVAEAVGASLGLSAQNVIAEATPESKSAFVARCASGGKGATAQSGSEASQSARADQKRTSVVMVGDGINDAAALAQADLGIALASGTNIAIESADVVIPSTRVSAVAETIDIARRTLRTIKQNLFFAFFYNAAAIPAAAFGLLGLYGPLIAAAAMGLSDITVIGNAIRLRRNLNRTKVKQTQSHA